MSRQGFARRRPFLGRGDARAIDFPKIFFEAMPAGQCAYIPPKTKEVGNARTKTQYYSARNSQDEMDTYSDRS